MPLLFFGCTHQQKYQNSDHFNGSTFFNPVGHKDKAFSELMKWQWTRKATPWPENVKNIDRPNLPQTLQDNQIAVTFVNHSTFLLQFKANDKIVNILTDPIYSLRTSPLSFAGPKRIRTPGLIFEDLPKIDIVLVSHNHYDHLDSPTLAQLYKKFDPNFVMPLGNKVYLDFPENPKVVERDWYETVDFKELDTKIHVDRAHHWSRRGFSDMNKALWGSFVIETPRMKIYFAGDTGYNSHFVETKKRHGTIDLSFIPIGAYEPRWFMKDAHLNPDDAVLAHIDLGSKQSIGIHFGTFPLTDEGVDAPRIDLEAAKKKYGVSNFEALNEGQTKIYTF